MDDPYSLKLARAQWRWRGTDRPSFAEPPKQGQISVWDFPRPPELIRDEREIVVMTTINEKLREETTCSIDATCSKERALPLLRRP